MREKHEKETALKAERDSMSKDATDREAAAQVRNVACMTTIACTYCKKEPKSSWYTAGSLLSVQRCA